MGLYRVGAFHRVIYVLWVLIGLCGSYTLVIQRLVKPL